MMLEAELHQCNTKKDRIAVLEEYLDQAIKREQLVKQLINARRAAPQTALKAKAARLKVEIALQQAKSNVYGQIGSNFDDQVAYAQGQLAIKRAVLKVAEAKKKIAVAAFETLRAQVAQAQELESVAEKQFKRIEGLAKQKVVSSEDVDELRDKWEAAKARRSAAEGRVIEGEARIKFEQARVELAELEVGY